MTYRDEKPGLELRVQDLEAELAEARETIARLQGAEPVQAERDEVDAWTGAPSHLVLTRELPFEVTDRGLETIAEMIRTRYPAAPITQIGRRLHAQLPFAELRLERTTAGRTLLRATRAPIGLRAGSLLVAFAFTVLGAIPIAAALKALAVSPAFFVASLPLVVIAAVLAARALVRRGQRGEKERLVGAFESMAALARSHAILAVSGAEDVGIRITTEATVADVTAADVTPEGEALAEAEAAALEARAGRATRGA